MAPIITTLALINKLRVRKEVGEKDSPANLFSRLDFFFHWDLRWGFHAINHYSGVEKTKEEVLAGRHLRQPLQGYPKTFVVDLEREKERNCVQANESEMITDL